MAVRPALILLRNLFALFCVMALIAFLTERAMRHPHGRFNKTMLNLAYIPQFVTDTVHNMIADRFGASRTPDIFGSATGFRPVTNHTTHRIEGLAMRGGQSKDRPQPGWRLLYGIFQIDGAPRYAVLVLSPAFAVEHLWLIDRKDVDESALTFGEAPYPHGFALLSDGSILAGFDTDYRTIRLGPCGERRWLADTRLNHAIYPAERERVAWGVDADDSIAKIDLATGRTVRRITPVEIARANPDISALDMLRIDDNGLGDNSRVFAEGYYYDPYHINDAEPLPPELASAFPQFRTGDLLLSFRSLNMVAVVDPDSLRIKWFTNDYSFRQHDPDWEKNGTISVLDNQMGRGFSRIIAFDPATGGHRTIVNGRSIDFYTRIRGKHQALDKGGMLITSSGQGRIVELGSDDRIAWEMLVHDPAHPGSNFVVSEATFLPADTPLLRKALTCPKS